MPSRIKIRGIYSTALTRMALDGGHLVVEPSARLCGLFGLSDHPGPPELFIQNKEDLQGIELSGEPERVTQFLTYLQERLLDALLLRLESLDDSKGWVKAYIEFPGASKQTLDEIRATVCPTVSRHHLLRIIDSDLLNKVERALENRPHERGAIEQQCFQQAIFAPLQKQGAVKLEHARPSGKPMRPREGVILSAERNRICFKRTFSGGRYDGLDLPIERGDYGVTEVEEGSWFLKHSYHAKDGRLKGEYCNINTPVEFYPYGARYVDLEVDVVRPATGQPVLLDREKLSMLHTEGRISKMLEEKALQVADELMQTLRC